MLSAHTFSLKNLFFALGLAVVVASFASINFVNAASGSCADITGQATPVLVGGVPNSGTIYFDPDTPAFQYETCSEDNILLAGDGPFEIKGWSWNDNLGWISFYCGDENGDGAPPYENLGIYCGDFIYGVTMEGLVGTNPGRMSGYAWGDNIGWISFNCADSGTCVTSNYYVEIETSAVAGAACIGEIYGAFPPDASCLPRVEASRYAWSDNVGWIDFSGVKFPWVQLIAIAVDVNLEILSDGVDLLLVDKNSAPVADNDDSYEMILHLTKSVDGSAIIPADYTITSSITWHTDTVDFNQVDIVKGGGAVTKPATHSGAYSGDAYTMDVKSYAPTSSMNGYDSGGYGSVDSSYESFILGDPLYPTAIPTNDLVLGDFQVSVKHNSTGICAFGGLGCGLQSVATIPKYIEADFHFVPAVEVSEFSDSINGDTISATRTVANSIDYQVDCRGILVDCPATSISIDTGIASPFVFVKGDDCLGASNFLLDLSSTFVQVTPWIAAVAGECPASGPTTGEDVYLYSTVSYVKDGNLIKYFSNKLPRIEGTLVTIPVASIMGNVYSTGVTDVETGQEVRSFGDVSTNILRNTLNKNVEALIAGVVAPEAAAVTVTGFDTLAPNKGFQVDEEGRIARLLPEVIGSVPRVYYFTGDTTIAGVIDWTGERTIIVKGADLYINENIYTTNPFAQMGIIVLQDLVTGDGGNIYVGPNVTNIQANIFADGTLFSYDPANGVSANGEPVWADEADRYDSLKSQVYFYGNIASMNTIGGAATTPPILGDGTEEASGEGSYTYPATGRSRARNYDLNFLRYYGYVFARHTALTNPLCVGATVEQSNSNSCPGDGDYNIVAQPVASGGDLVLISDSDPSAKAAKGLSASDVNAVYVNFDPPSATLPGFGVSTGVDIIIRP